MDYDSDDDSIMGGDMYGGYGTKAGAKNNKWLKFLKKNLDKGYTRAELAKEYKKDPTKSLKRKAKKKKATSKKSTRTSNKWIKFLKRNKGKNYTRAQLSKEYKKDPNKNLPKKK
jgi:hypothetical protein